MRYLLEFDSAEDLAAAAAAMQGKAESSVPRVVLTNRYGVGIQIVVRPRDEGDGEIEVTILSKIPNAEGAIRLENGTSARIT